LENPLILFAEGAGEDGGGGGGGTPPPDALAEFRAEISTTLKNLATEIAGIKKNPGGVPTDLSGITAAIAELKQDLAAIKEGKAPEKPAEGDKEPAVDEASRQQLTAMEKELKTLTTALATEKARSQEAETKREASEARQRGLERDRMIVAAYRAAGGRDDVDDKTVLRQFREEFTYSDNEVWVTEEGVDIAGHIKKHLPAFMKKPKTSTGGGGGQTPGGEDAPTLAQLKQAALDAGIKAKKAGVGSREFLAYERSKRAFGEAGGNIAEITDAVTQN
jgi:hypothetical protein